MTRRGQFVIVSLPGDYGKPRPALVVQNDIFAKLPSIVVCPLTSTVRNDADEVRIAVSPTRGNGLNVVSDIAIDKISVVPASKISAPIGKADDELMMRVTRALAFFLNIV
jgi:mRNA interferase MazF